MLLKKENIICISSIDWDFSWQGHQEIMSTLARNGNKVLFIENTGIRPPGIKDFSRIRERIANWRKGIKGFRKQQENLYIYSPLILPFPYSIFSRGINRYLLLRAIEMWMKTIDFSNPVIWTWLPTNISLDIIDNIPNKLIIYYCADNFAGILKRPNKVKKTERELINKADVIFCTAEGLREHCEKYRSKDKNSIFVFPYGVNLAKFNNMQKEKSTELAGLPKPIIGFIGSVKRHIDFELVEHIAKNNPEKSIVFIGYVERYVHNQVARLKSLRNVYFLGQKQHYDLMSYIEQFNICIIPYLLTEYTRTLYPAKLYEYLITGKPVISTPLPEIEYFNQKYGNIISVAADREEFAQKIEEALYKDRPEERAKRIEAAQDNSWARRLEKMEKIIQDAIEKKALERDVNWKENLLTFYRSSRRHLVRLTLVGTLLYCLFFYTPFIWFLAESLKIVDIPQHSDVIVVFAGGVGESGKAGQGYEERLKYAVELYKKGYAPNLVFSSGYTYAFQEAEVMKTLAVSLGVSPTNISLEKKAKNTYENVKYAEKLLSNKGWNKILLVSSPYHMRRASLVFKKVGKDIDVIYTPIPHSLYYDRSKGVKLQHIHGILHEYLGILYYWIKGYI